MPRISVNDEKNYQQEKNGDWLTLADDGDIARVQFLMETIDDIPVFAVHKVQVGERERYVNCLREYNDPLEVCPLCMAGFKVQVVRFILMYDHADFKVKMWERGPTFITRLQGLMNRYNQDPFPYYVFEIERHGKKGDQKTKYEVFPMDRVEPYDVSEVEVPEFLGGLIIDSDAEGMEMYLNRGNFPQAENENYQPPQAPPRRNVPANQQSAPQSPQAVRRANIPAGMPQAAPQAAPQQTPAPVASRRAPAEPQEQQSTVRRAPAPATSRRGSGPERF